MKKTLISLSLFSSLLCHLYADYPVMGHRYLADPSSLVTNNEVSTARMMTQIHLKVVTAFPALFVSRQKI